MTDELPDDDGGDYDNADDSGNASITRDEAIKIQKSRIQSLSLDIRESKLNISKLEKKVQKRNDLQQTGWNCGKGWRFHNFIF